VWVQASVVERPANVAVGVLASARPSPRNVRLAANLVTRTIATLLSLGCLALLTLPRHCGVVRRHSLLLQPQGARTLLSAS